MSIETDVLVIGAGLAGLNAAYAASASGASVIVTSKGPAASDHIMGFSAPLSPQDSPDEMISDCHCSGCGIENNALVDLLCRESVMIPGWMEEDGQIFDRQDNGAYALIHSLGHSHARLIHHGTSTGTESIKLLKETVKASGVTLWENTSILKLLRDEEGIIGAIAYNPEKDLQIHIHVKSTVIACGGVHLCNGSTYDQSQTGDGMALAYHAGAALQDLEFIQHEPLRLLGQSIGISTTMLGPGCRIVNGRGDEFLPVPADKITSLTKDRMSALFEKEIYEGRSAQGGILVDLTKTEHSHIVEKHAAQYQKLLRIDIDLTKQPVIVRPVAHTIMGGIRTDENCFTGVPGMYAAGESLGGLHGASRLGGNAGSEVYVFGRIAGREAARSAKLRKHRKAPIPELIPETRGGATAKECKSRICKICADVFGPVRTEDRLCSGLSGLDECKAMTENLQVQDMASFVASVEAKNLFLIACLAMQAAKYRKESRGSHTRLDYPCQRDEYTGNIVFSMAEGMVFIPKG